MKINIFTSFPHVHVNCSYLKIRINFFPSWFSHRNTVDGSEIQPVYPIVYKVLYIPDGFVRRISEPSTVSPQLNRKWIQPSNRLPSRAEMVGKLHKSQRNPSTFGGTISGLLTIYFELFVKRTNKKNPEKRGVIFQKKTYNIYIYMNRERGRELVSWFGFLMRWFSGGHCWF